MKTIKNIVEQLSIEERHTLILEIIRENAPITQKHIEHKLNAILDKQNKNYAVSHSTVVRDLKKLDVHKDSERNYFINQDYAVKKDKETLSMLLGNYFLKSYDNNISFFAIKNTSGASELIAHHIKKIYHEKIIGSISGEDFSLFFTKNSSSSTELLNEINKLHRESLKSDFKK